MKQEKWKCKQCGKCCQFVVIALEEAPDLETTGYLEAHGIRYANGKLLIPARCEYLEPVKDGCWETTKKYRCSIQENKFAACRLAGKKECEVAQRDYASLTKT